MLGRLTNRGGKGAVARSHDLESVRREIDSLTRENRDQPDLARERELLRLRQLAGLCLAEDAAGQRRDLIEPDHDALNTDAPVPEISADQVSAGLIRAAILRHGSVLVRGLVDPQDATRLAEGIDRAFAQREASENGGRDSGYYEELSPVPPNEPITHRGAVRDGGGVLAPDSPRMAFEMFDVFEKVGLPGIVGDYLGEAPAISADKTTLRKAVPSVPGAWHQDGKFLGDVNSVNLWLSLSHCGDTAPGMDLVPRRLEEIVDAGVGAEGFSRIVVAHERAVELAGEDGIIRPIFEPGDAMFFDHLFLHQTASDPAMPNPRFAIESWFFGPSAFPGDYIPLAV